MESDTIIKRKITAKEIAEKFNINGTILSFSVPMRNNSKVVSDKHLLFTIKVEGKHEGKQPERRLSESINKTASRKKDK